MNGSLKLSFFVPFCVCVCASCGTQFDRTWIVAVVLLAEFAAPSRPHVTLLSLSITQLDRLPVPL